MTAAAVIVGIAVLAALELGFAILIGRSIRLGDSLADVGNAPGTEDAA